MNKVLHLKTFISCPSDVKVEKEILKNQINHLNRVIKDVTSLYVESFDWTNLLPQTPHIPEETIQIILNKHIPESKIFILILHKRYGSKEAGHTKSNTEREVEVALNILKTEKKIKFLAYFKQFSPTDDQGYQEKSVIKFKNYLKRENVFYKEFKNKNDFTEMITHDLYETVLRYRFSSKKLFLLKKFWKFGEPHDAGIPELLFIYPAMDREFMGNPSDKDVWLNRLEPNIVFEDFKALQKLQNGLRLIGLYNYRIFNSAKIPSEVNSTNRFWICLPRSYEGRQYLKSYADRSKFDIIRTKDRVRSYFLWKNASCTSGDLIKINSPLAKYLKIQREKIGLKENWNSDLEKIIAKDYAIIARFKDTHGLFDYFLAGIRGLGTWGAGWLVDKRPELFDSLENEDDFQFLLEIEFRNGRIVNVIDVSNETQDYFNNENSLSTIKRNIQIFNPNRI